MRALVFDLDGTLADTVDDIHASVNLALAEFAMPQVGREKVIASVGGGVGKLIEQIVPDAAMRPRTQAKFIEHYGAHLLDRTALYPGAREALEALRGFALGVLSNKPEAMTTRIVAALGVAPFFAVVLGGDSLPVKKPDPSALTRTCERLGVAPGETMLVGDSRFDVQTAKGAGAVSCAVTWGYAKPGDLEGADYVVDTFAGVVEVARKIASPARTTARQRPPESQ